MILQKLKNQPTTDKMISNRMRTGLFTCVLLLGLSFLACHSAEPPPTGPYFGNGVHNGWADQNSISLWTRLTNRPDGNLSGTQFLDISKEEHERLRQLTDMDSLHGTQIPTGLTLDDMIGACPGSTGEVQLEYFPMGQSSKSKVIAWQAVDPSKDHTLQWKLGELQAGTRYQLRLQARSRPDMTPSDTLLASFITPPAPEVDQEDIRFCVVTCHDFIRRDDPENGHQIYPAMAALQPDFYVHAGDIEYYDKPLPYAMTEEMMHFKWNRLFALPFQRDFFNRHTTYFMKDDHDVLSDDAYPGMTYGTVDYQRGLEIFDQEQFPSHDKGYKTIQWGKDLQIWIVEGRNYRSKNTDPDGPGKTIWGAAQKQWFFETVQASDATFKVLFTSTPILGPDRKRKRDNYSNSNFQHEGQEIRDFINQQSNFFISNGDRHWQYVTHFEGTNLWEFSAGSGADAHAGGWKQEDVRPEHRFLRVKGGFLSGTVIRKEGEARLVFQHHDVAGSVVHEEVFLGKQE